MGYSGQERSTEPGTSSGIGSFVKIANTWKPTNTFLGRVQRAKGLGEASLRAGKRRKTLGEVHWGVLVGNIFVATLLTLRIVRESVSLRTREYSSLCSSLSHSNRDEGLGFPHKKRNPGCSGRSWIWSGKNQPRSQ